MQPHTPSPVDALDYPVLRFVRGMLFPARSASELTECTKSALRQGFFRDQLLVGANGQAVAVVSARKLHGIGPLWGYNLFLNQRIKVDLAAQTLNPLTLEEVRRKALGALNSPQQWEASLDVDDTRAKIRAANSIREIALAATQAYYGPKQVF